MVTSIKNSIKMTKKIHYILDWFGVYLINAINFTIITNDSWFKVLRNLSFDVLHFYLGLVMAFISYVLSRLMIELLEKNVSI